MLSDSELEEIRARERAATPGPWTLTVGAGAAMVTDDAVVIFAGGPEDCSDPGDDTHPTPADKAFLDNARTDIPKLLSEVDELRARVADSVPRAVAERACALMGAAVTAHCHDYPLSIIIACINADNVTWRIPAYASGELYRACIAHAERKSPRAEAGAKAQP